MGMGMKVRTVADVMDMSVFRKWAYTPRYLRTTQLWTRRPRVIADLSSC